MITFKVLLKTYHINIILHVCLNLSSHHSAELIKLA